MTTSALRRQVKNLVHNYSEAEIKVREATSNDPWGPPSSLMAEIADLTFSTVAFAEVMGMLWRRLNDSGKNWRHVYKALTLLDCLLKTGSERVARQCRENLYTIQTLKDFQYIDRDGKDQGVNVREKVKQVMALLRDEEQLRQERAHAFKTRARMALEGVGGGTRGSPSSCTSAASSPRYASDLEQARPQTSGEEELQLQLALAMSREEAEKEVQSWRGEDSPVASGPRASACHRRDRDPGREERKEKPKTGQPSILDLADICVPTPVPPSTRCSADPWDIPGLRPSTEPSGSSWGPSADPWSPVPSGNMLSRSQPWDLLPTLSSSEPWGRTPVLPARPRVTDPWAPDSPHHPLSSLGADPWGASTEPFDTPAVGGVSTFDPFAKTPEPTETKAELQGAQAMSSGKPSSPMDLDPFGEPSPSSKQNGTKEPDAFSLGVLGEVLSPAPHSTEAHARRTPESFLGPSASSLVNLDSLIKVPQAAKTRNPFLTGLSAPSSTNPFGAGEQVAPTLNQMRTGSPVPIIPMGVSLGSMTYSASLPLPLSSVPVGRTLPASASAFPQAGAYNPLAPSLPPPLLPTSSLAGSLQESRQMDTNPFL
ncbi:epsin-3 isoform X2 [Fukomys damarensis]|uniref:epsin-3 isoform X2 n=1 Tax=Fukomys damarensis TaxID=885580 RepID=UPI00053FAB84|nr:epsin-3 isoform X2 [Fukomys damarensis]